MPDYDSKLYYSYLDLWETGKREGIKKVTLEQLDKLLKRFSGGFGTFSYAIQDYSTGTFQYVADDIDRVWGYSAEEFHDKGTELYFEAFIPEHNETHFKLSKAGWEYVHQLAPEQMLRTSANFDHPLRKKSGELRRMLTRQIVVSLDGDNKIWLCLVIFTDISHIKPPNINDPPQLSLHIPKTNNFLVYNPATDSMINLDILTQREKEVIQLYAQDKVTKEIARELYISPYTVQTHRTNILEKTGCRNLAELVHFSKCHFATFHI